MGPAELGGAEEFARLPFTIRFLNYHGMGSRTVVYLRDRGRVESVIALDRAIGEPGITPQQTVALVKVAPLLGQMIAVGTKQADPVQSSPRSSITLAELTEREAQIARMVGRGLNNGEVAQELALSTGTVKVHMGHIYRKVGVKSRAELVSLVLSRNSGSDPPGRRANRGRPVRHA